MVTELDLTPGRQEIGWTVNIDENDASNGIDIRPAASETKYGVKKIIFNTQGDKWIKILNGTDILLGPFTFIKNSSVPIELESPVYCDTGNALRLQTEVAFPITLVIEGKTAPPISSPSSSVSASPSQ